MKRSLLLTLALVALAVLALGSCGSDDGDSEEAAAATEAEATAEPEATAEVELVEGVEAEVLVVDNYFRPEVITVEAGTEVIWTNKGQTSHNIVPSADGEFGV